jgi:hypothetical protein
VAADEAQAIAGAMLCTIQNYTFSTTPWRTRIPLSPVIFYRCGTDHGRSFFVFFSIAAAAALRGMQYQHKACHSLGRVRRPPPHETV